MKAPKGLHALFQGDEQGVPREEIPPSPRVAKSAHRETFIQGVDRERSLSVSGGDIEKGETPVDA